MKTTHLAKVAAPIHAAALAQLSKGWVWIGVADQAKLVRGALKDAFPAVKFSVTSKSYAGGSSITVKWVDGPTTKAVDAIVQGYRGGGFDGSIDLAYDISRWLAGDGTVTLAHSAGSEGSMGANSEQIGSAHRPDAVEVHFAGNYIHTNREYSDGRKAAALEDLRAKRGAVAEIQPAPRFVTKTFRDHSWLELERDHQVDGEWLSSLVWRQLEALSF